MTLYGAVQEWVNIDKEMMRLKGRLDELKKLKTVREEAMTKYMIERDVKVQDYPGGVRLSLRKKKNTDEYKVYVTKRKK